MGKTKWHTSTIIRILSNEKYKGDALLQKGYISDFYDKYEQIKAEYNSLIKIINKKHKQKERFIEFINNMENTQSTITEFDEGLWCSLIDYVTIYTKENIIFTLKNGQEIKA